MNPLSIIKKIGIRQLDKSYEKELKKRRLSYDTFIRREEARKKAVRGKAAPEKAVRENVAAGRENAGSFALFRQREGRLSEDALERIGLFFKKHPAVQIVYGEEDLEDTEGIRHNPWYKPDWSPDLYDSCFYPGSVIAVRKELLEKTGKVLRQGEVQIVFEKAAEIRKQMDELFFLAGGFGKGCRSIGHLEDMLFHVKGEAVWADYLKTPCSSWFSEKMTEVSYYKKEEKEIISVVIPSKDNPEILKTCLLSLAKGEFPGERLEIVVVDNGSNAENRAAVEGLQKQLAEMSVKMQYVYEPMEFNFSAMCNRGAELSNGEYVLFLNDDMEMCQDGWLYRMVEKAALPYVGAVGLKLYYPDSVVMQHDGIVNLPVGPVHKLQFMEDNRSYYFERNRHTGNCVAVTGACMLMRRQLFQETGGFCEELRVAYNDVELCFRLVEEGYFNVVVREYHGFHHESLSRGTDESPQKQRRLEAERELLYKMHPRFLGEDPFYPSGLNREGLDSRVVPGYVTAGNVIQESGFRKSHFDLSKCRRDDCLMARVETAGPEKIQGYSVILGDDNACYEKYLLLISKTDGIRYEEKLDACYRQDLEENLPDQKNVALGGFCVSRRGENLPAGEYEIALLAVHKVTRGKLWNTTGKELVK